MYWEREIEVGQRYRDARLTAFGAPSQKTWVVDRIWAGSDGLQYVELVDESEPDRTKVISTLALADRRFYVPPSVATSGRVSRMALAARRRFKMFSIAR